MYSAVVKNSKVNIRSGPGVSYTDIGDPIGDVVMYDLVIADRKEKDIYGVDWWHIARIIRKGLDVSLPAIDCWVWSSALQEFTFDFPSDIELQIELGDDIVFKKELITAKLQVL